MPKRMIWNYIMMSFCFKKRDQNKQQMNQYFSFMTVFQSIDIDIK